MKYQFITCKKCGATLRLPKINGRLEITCPKCGYKFMLKSVKKQPRVRTLAFLGICSGFILLIGVFANQLLIEVIFSIIGLAVLFCAVRASKEATFNIICAHVNNDTDDRYFRTIALINSLGNSCTKITILREKHARRTDKFTFTADFQWMGSTLTWLSDFLLRENKRIEQEISDKTKGWDVESDAGIEAHRRVWREGQKKRQELQDLADNEFYKALLGQADSESNRKLVYSPFHCFASSWGERIIDEDYWEIAPGGEGSRYKGGGLYFFPGSDKEDKYYNPTYALPALKKVMAQYGLNMPIVQTFSEDSDR